MEMNFASKLNNDHQAKAFFLEHFLKENYGFTCDYVNENIKQLKLPHPSTMNFNDLENKKISHTDDRDNLLLYCQNHTCSSYCMKEFSGSKKRKCRVGCGEEGTCQKCNTPGFPQRKFPKLVKDARGHSRIQMTRNNQRIVQSSVCLLQSWRANCDIQLIVYNSTDHMNPDIKEVASITDYIVAYQCKGNESFINERENLVNFSSAFETNDTTMTADQKTLARKILNKISGSRLISKQEAMVQLSGLPLWLSTEKFTTISLTSSYRIDGYQKTDLNNYKTRHKHFANLSLDQFIKNTKTTIPHYVGPKCQPTYPVTKDYAR